MKIFIAVLLALALSAGLAAAIQQDSGYILIAYGQTTVEMTIWVGVAVLTVKSQTALVPFGLCGARCADAVIPPWV